MIAVHKINGDFCEDVFALIAVHSSLEDYAMVYTINQYLKSNFKRFSKDLDVSEHASFPYFEWKDNVNDAYWTLITNNRTKETYTQGNNLFNNEPSYTKHYLIPEYKEVDYFLKIEQDDTGNVAGIVKLLFSIPKVQTAYEVDPEKIKSKNNLIF